MRRALLGSVLAPLVAALALALPGPGAGGDIASTPRPEQVRRSGRGPAAQHRRDHGRRHARLRPGGDAARAGAAPAAGHDVRPQLRVVPAVLPLARLVPHRAVRAQPRRPRQRAAAGRVPGVRPVEHRGDLARRRGLPDGVRREVPQRVRHRATGRGPAGLGRLARLGRRRPLLPQHPVRERHDEPVRRPLPHRPLGRHRDRRDRPARPSAGAAVPLGVVLRAPHRRPAGARRPGHQHAGRGAPTPRRVRRSAAAPVALLQRGRRLGQARATSATGSR